MVRQQIASFHIKAAAAEKAQSEQPNSPFLTQVPPQIDPFTVRSPSSGYLTPDNVSGKVPHLL